MRATSTLGGNHDDHDPGRNMGMARMNEAERWTCNMGMARSTITITIAIVMATMINMFTTFTWAYPVCVEFKDSHGP